MSRYAASHSHRPKSPVLSHRKKTHGKGPSGFVSPPPIPSEVDTVVGIDQAKKAVADMLTVSKGEGLRKLMCCVYKCSCSV